MAPIQTTLAIQLGYPCADGQVEDGDGAWLPPPSVRVPLVSLEGLLTFWTETRDEEDSYMMITLKGRFKGEGKGKNFISFWYKCRIVELF